MVDKPRIGFFVTTVYLTFFFSLSNSCLVATREMEEFKERMTSDPCYTLLADKEKHVIIIIIFVLYKESFLYL